MANGDATGAFCAHCGRNYGSHGASEVVTRKLGFAPNQKHLVCLPDGQCASVEEELLAKRMKSLEELASVEQQILGGKRAKDPRRVPRDNTRDPSVACPPPTGGNREDRSS